ncbi:hypothetical protein CLI84_01265 [Porphyromonas gingivalis]|nr:hypothetical protein CLI84_01265 [Porphyromonas gingivalis]
MIATLGYQTSANSFVRDSNYRGKRLKIFKRDRPDKRRSMGQKDGAVSKRDFLSSMLPRLLYYLFYPKKIRSRSLYTPDRLYMELSILERRSYEQDARHRL